MGSEILIAVITLATTLAGVIAGSLLNEYFRRSNRIEGFGGAYFKKRFGVLENIHRMVMAHYVLISGDMEDFQENYQDLIEKTPISYFDENELYITEDLAFQVFMYFVGKYNYVDMDKEERENKKEEITKLFGQTRQAIKQATGFSEMETHFKSVAKAKPDTELIRAYQATTTKARRSFKLPKNLP